MYREAVVGNLHESRSHSNTMKSFEQKTRRQLKLKIGRSAMGCCRPIWLTWHKYLGLTTIPGLQSVHNAQGKFFTFAWSLLFARSFNLSLARYYGQIGMACTIRDVYVNCSDYLSYPVTTAMNLKQAAALPFPAVTVCNLNRVHCGNLRGLVQRNRGTDLGERLERLYEVTGCAEVRRRPSGNDRYGRRFRREDSADATAQGQVTTESSAALPTPKGEDVEPVINQTQSFNELMNFLALYANFSEEYRIAMGHEAAGFIRACTFSGKSCSNVTLFFKTSSSTGYGNCFTFTTTRRTVIPGRDYGLSMEIYLDQPNYIGGGLSPRSGARVVVHPSSQAPLPNENGLTIQPHTATSAALEQVQVTREKLPYVTNCTSGWERTWYEARVPQFYGYSMKVTREPSKQKRSGHFCDLKQCQRVCLQLAFEDSCYCTHPSYMDIPTGISPCNLTSDNMDYDCVARVLEEFETGARGCSCNMDCRETTYGMTISQAAWPNENNWCEVAQRFGMARSCKGENYRLNNGERVKELVLQNVLTIDVFFENLRVQSIEQHPTYKLQSFVGSLGGALSLYLGITLFMLLEVLEVFVRLIFASFHRGCCFVYKRGLTATRNRSRRHKAQTRPGIFYTDFRFNRRVRLATTAKRIEPIRFAW